VSSTLGTNLIDRLVPLVDTIRGKLNPAMGLRQWTVTVVRRTWPSGKRGDVSAGPAILSELELLPQPKVRFDPEKGVAYQMRGAGREEEGPILLSEISLTYSEEQLVPKGLLPGEEFFYRLTDAQGQNVPARQYVPMGPPLPDREKDIGWTLRLSRRHVNE
jgi:hypothetical protein